METKNSNPKFTRQEVLYQSLINPADTIEEADLMDRIDGIVASACREDSNEIFQVMDGVFQLSRFHSNLDDFGLTDSREVESVVFGSDETLLTTSKGVFRVDTHKLINHWVDSASKVDY